MQADTEDIKYMKEALKLAVKGRGKVSPNPLVGAVIVRNGTVIGKGYHAYYGGPHAEINAIDSCIGPSKGSDLYVTLEPCNTYGKTPPCSERILKEGFRKVVIGAPDPSPNADGASVSRFKKAGIKVITGVMEEECRDINLPFYKYLNTGMPYILLKTASSLDGSAALDNGISKWISSEKSRKFVHELRNSYDAVMIGKNTALADDPSLTVRMIKGRDPARIVVDARLDLPRHLKIFDGNAPAYIITGSDGKGKETKPLNSSISLVKVEKKNGMLNISEALKILAAKGIRSIMVEGGPFLATYMLNNRLVDRINFFLCPLLIGGGKKFYFSSDFKKMEETTGIIIRSVKMFGGDILIDGIPEYRK